MTLPTGARGACPETASAAGGDGWALPAELEPAELEPAELVAAAS